MMAVPVRLGADARTLNVGASIELFETHLASGGSIFVAGANAKAQYAVGADGRFLLNASTNDATTSPITIVQNWTALMKR